MYFGGQNKTKKELFMTIKFEVASCAVSPFKDYFLLETFQSGGCSVVVFQSGQ